MAARELWRTPLFQDMMSVLQKSRPQAFPIRGDKVDSVAALIDLGMRNGYDTCLAMLESLVNDPPKAPAHIDADYGTAEDEQS